MKNINYISFDRLMGRLNQDLPNTNFKPKEPEVKQWVFEALRTIGSPAFLIKEDIEIKVEDGRAEIPSNVNMLRTVKHRGEKLSQVDSLGDKRILATKAYVINNMHIFTNFEADTLTLEVVTFPNDEYGRPLVLNKETVIKAVISYILFKLSKKLFINNKLREVVYRDMERDWLYYVGSATTSTLMPSFDETNEWLAFHSIMPMAYLHQVSSVDSTYRRVVD